jgi:hypothetical protein
MLDLLLKQPSIHVNTIGAYMVAEQKLTPLHDAAENGQAQACRLLVRAGADVTKTTVSGLLAIDLAAANGHIEIQQFLAASVPGMQLPSDAESNSMEVDAPLGSTVAAEIQPTYAAVTPTGPSARACDPQGPSKQARRAMIDAVVTASQRKMIQGALSFLFTSTRRDTISTVELVKELETRRIAATVTAQHVNVVLQELSNDNAIMVTPGAEIIRI